MLQALTDLGTAPDVALHVVAGLFWFLASLGAVTLTQRACVTSGLARAAWLAGIAPTVAYGVWSVQAVDPDLVTNTALGIALFGMAGSVLASWLVGTFMHLSTKNIREHDRLLDHALSYMSQGLCMFDPAGRLVLWNKRYVEMYNIQGKLQVGFTLKDILQQRMEAGTFSGDPDAFVRRVHAAVQSREQFKDVFELADGSCIAVSNAPRPSGGWVSTHDDVTAQRQAENALIAARAEAERAEQKARAAHQRLHDAFEVVPEGLVLLDADNRYVMWNRQYAELFGGGVKLVEGLRFEDVLRANLARGQHPEAKGREDEWIAERLAHHAQPRSSQEYQLGNGRWVRIEERRTADGGSVGVRIDITELKLREASFRLLFKGNPVPMWLYDPETLRFLDVNDAAIEHYGYSHEQFLGMTILDIRPAEDRASVHKLAQTESYSSDRTWRHVKADGSVIEVAVFSRALSYDGRPAGICAIVDLTDRKRADDEVRRTRAFLDAIINNVPSAIVVKEFPSLRYVLVNRAGEKHYGLPRERLIGKTPDEIFAKAAADTVNISPEDLETINAGREIFYDAHPISTPSGRTRIVTATRIPLMDAGGKPQYLISVIDDVTQRKRDEARIAHMARHDALTDLPNRAAFEEHLDATIAQAAAKGESFAALCIDLDRFKEVNDVFGHAVGDALLCSVAERMRRACEGAFIARLGGDEFIAISALGPQPAGAEAISERLYEAFASDIEVDGHPLRAELTIGVGIYPNDGVDATTLLANADAALYRAKADARGAIRFFEPDMDKRLREKRALQHDLRSAIGHGEIALHYQPQALIGGKITGFEALVRWHHPNLGMIPPGTFIPLAEESGLIISLGEWILREACREAASWKTPLNVAVNLSPAQFRHGDLANLVHTVLLETGLAPRRLELEITEGVLIDDFSRAMAILHRLKNLGVRIAMDDFGTGYSSLSYLQSFSFDKIKIDRNFVSNLSQKPQSAAIIRAVIGLAHGLKLPVIAEGVETREQLDFLAGASCDEVQGFLLGRPKPIGEYAELVGGDAPAPAHAISLAG